jgi:hypothetical protein
MVLQNLSALCNFKNQVFLGAHEIKFSQGPPTSQFLKQTKIGFLEIFDESSTLYMKIKGSVASRTFYYITVC